MTAEINNAEDIGIFVKEERNRRRLLQQDVAKKIGMSLKHYNRIENGHDFPTLKTLMKIMKFFKLTLTIKQSGNF